MDVSKLDKMKVVDLRNELQIRGLDTKGVKAVLVERLRIYLESDEGSGVGTSPAPGTPGRRSRRTRSMTRSPSPSLLKAAEPILESLAEEDASNNAEEYFEENSNTANNEQAGYDGREQDELSEEAEASNEAATGESVDAVEYEESAEERITQAEYDDEEEEDAINENNRAVTQQHHQLEQHAEQQSNANDKFLYENEPSDDVKQADESEVLTAVNSTNAEDKEATLGADNKAEEANNKHDILSSERRTVHRKRSHSRTRSRSHSKERRERHKSRDCSKSRSRTRSRSRSKHRHHSRGSIGKEDLPVQEDEPTIEDKRFGLSWFDSDLYLRIDPVNFNTAKPINNELYTLIWAGVRANYGVRHGKVCFEVRISEELTLTRHSLLRDEPEMYGFRVGFSVSNSSLLLGEAEKSFAYCQNARKAVNSDFTEYGKVFKLDDVIGCYLDLDSTLANIKYTLNGEDLGVAFEFDKGELLGEDGALFPHISTKGYEFSVNFADTDNLLVNAERSIRKRRKPRQVSEKTESEKAEKTLHDIVKEETKKNIQEATDADVEMTAIDAPDEIKSEQTVEKPTNENDHVVETEKEDLQMDSAAASNGDANVTAADSKEEETKVEVDVDKLKDDTSPSPNKRARRESNKRRESVSEDEYEEVVPEPREHMCLLPGYELVALTAEENLVLGPQRAESRKECEVILLIGLPGAGKTYWVRNRINELPEKRYHVIGADELIDRMTINGQARKTVHKGRWDKIYDLCVNSLSELEEIATKRRRNFILDQTNAYASIQRRKMKGFSDFKRIAVVCIPTDDELKRRNTEKSDKGNPSTLRETTVNNLRANFTLPSLEFGWFEDIIYTDLNADEAKEVVKSYNEKGKKAVDASGSTRDNKRRRDDRRRNDDRRRDSRNDNRWNDRRYQQQNRGGNRWSGGNSGYRSGGTGWRDDRGYGNNGGNMNSGGGPRGYDNRNRGYNVQQNQQNWAYNNGGRRRQDDRYGGRSGGSNMGSGGAGGSRYDSYGGGSGGGRDYRNRDRDRNGGGGGGGSGSSSSRRDNYRSGGGHQRDFRPGHRDTQTEDSRGGYERSAAASMKSNGGYDQYNKGSQSSSSSKGGKWVTFAQINQQQIQQQQRYQGGNSSSGSGSGQNWSQQQQQQQPQQYQHSQISGGNSQQQQQPYWPYQQMQGYDTQPHQQQQQQQQWQNSDAQTQQWMSWWQQHQNQPPPSQGGSSSGQTPTSSNAVDIGGGSSGGGSGTGSGHYWATYPYTTNQSSNSGGSSGDKK